MASKATTTRKRKGAAPRGSFDYHGVTILRPPFPPKTPLAQIRKAVRTVLARSRDEDCGAG